MDSGYAGFVTKPEGYPAFRYDTRSNGYSIASLQGNGTEFFICIPRSKAAKL